MSNRVLRKFSDYSDRFLRLKCEDDNNKDAINMKFIS